WRRSSTSSGHARARAGPSGRLLMSWFQAPHTVSTLQNVHGRSPHVSRIEGEPRARGPGRHGLALNSGSHLDAFASTPGLGELQADLLQDVGLLLADALKPRFLSDGPDLHLLQAA